MTDRISKDWGVSLDVKCLEPGCSCFREAVAGHMTAGGYAAPQDQCECPECHHQSARHQVLGESMSDYEKREAAKKPEE